MAKPEVTHWRNMRIEALTLREISIRLKTRFETSFRTTWGRRIVLVGVTADGVSGWGEVTAGEGPFYNPETTDTAWIILRDFIVPLALDKKLFVPRSKPLGNSSYSACVRSRRG